MCALEKEEAPSRDKRKNEKKSMTFIVSYSDVIKADASIVLNNELC